MSFRITGDVPSVAAETFGVVVIVGTAWLVRVKVAVFVTPLAPAGMA